MSSVQYWSVGSSKPSNLSLTHADISRFLLSDWLPDLPVSISRSVIGWPYYLVQTEAGTSTPYLFLSRIAGGSDRQWKGVLSWMLGVAGTRRVLDDEQYIYIAPCSAFYPERNKGVSIPSWHPKYPPSLLELTQNPKISSRLRPDYIAARFRSPGGIDFALVESKGSSRSLKSLTSCPTNWFNQVRNAVVKFKGLPIPIPRNIVVGTRCNPNAVRKKTRRLQVRAWNSHRNETFFNEEMLIEIVSAHYAALLRNLGLNNNLRALELAAEIRLRPTSKLKQQFDQAADMAGAELEQKMEGTVSGIEDAHVLIEAEFGIVKVQVSKHVIYLTQALRSAVLDPEHFSIINKYFIAIRKWYSDQIREHQYKKNISIDRSGFIVELVNDRI